MSAPSTSHPIRLGVNVDHVATLRQARYRKMLDHPNAEPCPIQAALEAEAAGAAGITAHLRADRRHMQDADVIRLRRSIRTKLNLEMGLSPEMLDFAIQFRPDDVCIVPENREEVTTEGGLDCVSHADELQSAIAKLQSAGIRVSLFIDPDADQVHTAARLKAEFIELHTGSYANAIAPFQRESELERLRAAASLAKSLGLRVNAGHGLNYQNVQAICQIPGIEELNIGHSIVSRALFVGMANAVREMLQAMNTTP